jgi:hypothetical protein
MSEPGSDTSYAPDRHNSRGLVGDVPSCSASASRALGRTLAGRQGHKFLSGCVTLCRGCETIRRLDRCVSCLCEIHFSASCQHGQKWICDILCCRFVFPPRVVRVDAWFPTCPSNPKAFYRRGNGVSADWPRGLIILITFFAVLTMFVWGAIENNRDPNSESLKRVTIYFVVFYVFFLVVVAFFSD